MKLNSYVIGAATLLFCWGAHGQIALPALPASDAAPAGIPANPGAPAKTAPATTGSGYGPARTAKPRAENPGLGYGLAGGGGKIGGVAPSAGITTTVTAAGVPPLVLRFSEAPAEQDAMMEEDLTIMTRLVEKALDQGMGEDTPEKRMGISLLYSGGGRSVRSVYLEGFGAVFMVKINQPVFAPAPAEKSPNAPPTAGNSDWDQARRELYGAADRNSYRTEGLKYNEKQVKALTRLLAQTFKNAANIRNLKPEEYVSFSVFGPPTVNAPAFGSVKGLPGAESDSEERQVAVIEKRIIDLKQNVDEAAKTKTDQHPDMVAMHSKLDKAQAELNRAQEQVKQLHRMRNEYQFIDTRGGQERGTILTMRAKKKDIEALAQGALSFEAFEQKLEQQAYAGYGHGVTSVNSWVR